MCLFMVKVRGNVLYWNSPRCFNSGHKSMDTMTIIAKVSFCLFSSYVLPHCFVVFYRIPITSDFWRPDYVCMFDFQIIPSLLISRKLVSCHYKIRTTINIQLNTDFFHRHIVVCNVHYIKFSNSMDTMSNAISYKTSTCEPILNRA